VIWQGDNNASNKRAGSFFKEKSGRNECCNPENYSKSPIVFDTGKKYLEHR
jgi:hypothetical protein